MGWILVHSEAVPAPSFFLPPTDFLRNEYRQNDHSDRQSSDPSARGVAPHGKLRDVPGTSRGGQVRAYHQVPPKQPDGSNAKIADRF